MKTFTQILKRNRLNVTGFALVYALLSAMVSVCGLLMYRLEGDLSQAAVSFETDAVVRFLGTMAVVVVIKTLAAALKSICSERFAGTTGYKMRGNFAAHFLRARFSDLSRKNSGELLSVFSNDMPQAVTYVSASVFDMAAEILTEVIVFVYMLTLQPVLTLIFFVLFPLLVTLQSAISAPIQKKSLEMSEAQQGFNAVVNDSLQNIPTVVAYSLENVMEERYLNAYDKYIQATNSYLRSFIPLIMAGISASFLPLFVIIAAAGFQVASGDMSIGEFVAFTSMAGVAGSWLAMFSQQLTQAQLNSARAKKVMESMDCQEEPYAEEGSGAGLSGVYGSSVAESSADKASAVSFSDVSFSYGGDKKILDGVSFDVRQGSRTAIVGPSGSGKSTALKLLLALYRPDAGTITLSGTDINGMPVKDLRGRLAYVPQDSFMFPESIRDNLTNGVPAERKHHNGEARAQSALGTTPASEKDTLREACANAGILDFIESLPQGFDTVLSESAENISGGQRQRLAIARAYLRNAPVVLFDEATAALDPLTEADVLKAFNKMTEGKTVLMVAHRPAAIEACDNIIMMTGGKIAGIGSHAELLTSCPEYAALHRHIQEVSHA